MKSTISTAILDQCDEVSSIFKSLSHPVRLKILCQVMEQDQSVNDLTDFCGISQSAMSQFLNRMKNEGILTSRREKTNIYYSIADRKLAKLLRAVKDIYC